MGGEKSSKPTWRTRLAEWVVVAAILGLTSSVPMKWAFRCCSVNAAREVTCRQQAHAILMALGQYRSTYNRWPTVIESLEPEVFVRDEYDRMAATLCAHLSAPFIDRLNPKRLVFLEAVMENDQRLVDPWGQVYRILIDHDDDEQVTAPGGTMIHASVLVWSVGPNGKDEGGVGDDIASWRR